MIFSRRSPADTPRPNALEEGNVPSGRFSRKRGKRPPLPGMRSGAATLLSPPPIAFRRAPRLLSRGERAFWYPLFEAVKGKYRIFCKVRLLDIVDTPSGSDRYWFKKVRGFHVDFVLCDPQTTAPLLVVELDDRSHNSSRVKERDELKSAVLAAAGLPLLRVTCQQAYDPEELGQAIRGHISANRADR